MTMHSKISLIMVRDLLDAFACLKLGTLNLRLLVHDWFS